MEEKQRRQHIQPAHIRLHKELKISFCCDIGCQNLRNTASNYKFDHIPAATTRQKNWQQLWLNEIKRADWTGTIIKHDRICSTHFYIHFYIIICNCIYIVVINCGWNINVAVKIVAWLNWNVFTSSSWLDRDGELDFTIHHVRRDPPHSNSPVRSSILWVRV